MLLTLERCPALADCLFMLALNQSRTVLTLDCLFLQHIFLLVVDCAVVEGNLEVPSQLNIAPVICDFVSCRGKHQHDRNNYHDFPLPPAQLR